MPPPPQESLTHCTLHVNDQIMLISATVINNYILKRDASQGAIFGGKFLPTANVLM